MLLQQLVLLVRLHTAVAYYAATCYKRDATAYNTDTRTSAKFWQYIDIYRWLCILRKTTGSRYEISISQITHDNATPSDITTIVNVLKEQNVEFKMEVTVKGVSIYSLSSKNLDLIYYASKAGWTVHKAETAHYRCFGKTTVLPPYTKPASNWDKFMAASFND